MSIYLSVLIFIAAIILVIKGGDWFVDAASWIAKAANIPSFIIGATIVSFATTLPELIVSVMASLEGKNDMAVGNAIGSVTANTGLIMAVAMMFMAIKTPRKNYFVQCVLLAATAGVLWIGSLSGSVTTWTVVILFLLFIEFMIVNVVDAKNHNEPEEEPVEKDGKTVAKNIFLFILGAVCIVVGSNLLISSGSSIAETLGVPERVIAVTLVAIGTSLPELITTITAIRKKQASLSVGNIIGANIIDLALILPICSLASGESFAVSQQCLQIDFPFCFIVTLVAIVPMMIKERAYKLQGALLLLIYAAYLVITVI